jgi:hypothetical protein
MDLTALQNRSSWKEFVFDALIAAVEEAGLLFAANILASMAAMSDKTDPVKVMKMVAAEAKRRGVGIVFLWDEIQYLQRLDSLGDLKFLISNYEHDNVFHVVTGSGMALAWFKFGTYSPAGHTVLGSTKVVNVPYASNVLPLTAAIVLVTNEYPNLPLDVLEAALRQAPRSAAGVVFYAWRAGLLKINTVTNWPRGNKVWLWLVNFPSCVCR